MIGGVVVGLGLLVALAAAVLVARVCARGPVERFTLHADVDLPVVAEALPPEVLVPAPVSFPVRPRVAGFREVAA